jgi:NADH-quinone oxidoreductase subunit F
VTTYAELRSAADAAWAPIGDPGRPLIKVGIATCSRTVGAEETIAALQAAAKDADVMLTGCMGACYAEPLVQVRLPGKPAVLYQNVTADRVPELLAAVSQGVTATNMAMAVLDDTARATCLRSGGCRSSPLRSGA